MKPQHLIENGILKEYHGNYDIVSIPEGVTEVKSDTFEMFVDRKETTNVFLPDSLIRIPQFQHCRNLSYVTIGNNVTHIDPHTFKDTGLLNICVPDSVETIGDYAFSDCKRLTFCVLGYGLKLIGKCAFQNSGLEKLIIFDSPVEVIGEGAFQNCVNLSYVHLGSTLNKIGSNAFSNCTMLREIFIPKSVKTIEPDAFKGCKNLTIYVEHASKPDEWIETAQESWNCEDSLVFYDVEEPPFLNGDITL